jgi:ribosomal protein S12 methylthiotransferase accessory factor
VPGRVGCGHCARQRIRAAVTVSAAAAADADVPLAALEDELRAIRARGVASSRLLNHVLNIGDGTYHRVIPLPRCPVCGGAAALVDPVEEHAPADPFAGWVDPLTGVVPAIALDETSAPESGLPFVVTAVPPHIVADDGSVRVLPAGWGKGLTLPDALRSALGEAIERYSASLPDPGRLLWRPLAELPGDVLDPRSFPLYDDEQYAAADFPFVPFDPNAVQPWIRGTWLATNADVWVPAIFAFLSLTIEPRQLFCQGTSNGLAASTSLPDAAYRATLELVERDALMTAWLTGTPAKRLRLDDALAPSLRRVLAAIESLGARVELYLLPAAAGTAVLALALGDGEKWPGATLGLAADLDPARAVRQAILELGQTGPYLRRLLRSLAPPTAPTAVREMLDHATFYFPRERATAFNRLRDSNETVELSPLLQWEGEQSLTACATQLTAGGIRVAIVDVTSPDVATSPFRVARAISPELQPISYGHGFDRAPVARIRAHVAAPAPIHPIW